MLLPAGEKISQKDSSLIKLSPLFIIKNARAWKLIRHKNTMIELALVRKPTVRNREAIINKEKTVTSQISLLGNKLSRLKWTYWFQLFTVSLDIMPFSPNQTNRSGINSSPY